MSNFIKVQTSLPKNISEEDKHLFEPIANYKCRISEVKNIKNAFVTHEGLVLKNGLLVKGCAFNLLGKEDNTMYFEFWKDTLEKYAVCKWGKSLKSKHLKGSQKYLLIHSKWFNYSFWVNSFLLRLILAEKKGLLSDVKLLVPERWGEIDYVIESLKTFNIAHEIIPEGHHLFVDNLVMPETREWTSSFNPNHIQKLSKRLIRYAEIINNNAPLKSSRIYLTRSNRGVRCVENENEVIKCLKLYNFEVVTFESLTIWEQIILMSNTKHFVSIHGAGFTNCIFMPNNASVLELINKEYAKQEYTFPFWKLANAVSLKYYYLMCGIVNNNKKHSLHYKGGVSDENYLVNQNIIVDINKFEQTIINMIK